MLLSSTQILTNKVSLIKLLLMIIFFEVVMILNFNNEEKRFNDITTYSSIISETQTLQQ